MAITSEKDFQQLLLGGDWELISNAGREFLICTTAIGTFTFVPMFFHPGRLVTAWQWKDNRLPAGADLCAVDDQSIITLLNRGLDAALKGRALEAEKKALERANRPLDDGDVLNTINSVGACRLMRVVVARVDSPSTYITFSPDSFDLSKVPRGYFPAGVVYLALDTQGHRVGCQTFRGVEEVSAHAALRAAEASAVRRVNHSNRTELEISIKNGSFFG